MNILLANDKKLIRQGLRELLVNNKSILIEVTDADSFEEAIHIANANKDIDICIFLINEADIAEQTNLDAVFAISELVLTLIVSSSEDPSAIREVVNAGARGYIASSQSSDVFIAAIQLILSGGVYLPHFLVDVDPGIVEDKHAPQKLRKARNTETVASRAKNLTTRQKEVLCLLSSGASNKEIGAQLNLAEATIRTHIAAIYKVLNVHNRTQASRVAMETGLDEPVS